MKNPLRMYAGTMGKRDLFFSLLLKSVLINGKPAILAELTVASSTGVIEAQYEHVYSETLSDDAIRNDLLSMASS